MRERESREQRSEPLRFVGRERELAALHARLAAADDGQPSVALISGEPGIGKTRLLQEFAEQAEADGWEVLRGQSYEFAGLPPYFPILQALRGSARPQAPKDFVPEAGGAQPLGEQFGRPAGSDWERYRLFEDVAAVVREMASTAERGVLLILDDLHWADGASLELLHYVIRRCQRERLLVVLAYRTPEPSAIATLSGLIAGLSREQAARLLGLGPLSHVESALLLHALHRATIAPDVGAAILRDAEGNPFFLEQTVRHLEALGIDLSHAHARRAGWSTPPSVLEVVGRRLVRLSETTNTLLQAGAILGDGIAFELLALMTQLDDDSLLEGIEQALAAGLLREDNGQYQFTHALIRQAVLERLSLPRRQRLHRRAAEAIEARRGTIGAAQVMALAGHYRAAGSAVPSGKALEYSLAASDAAASVFDWEAAVSHRLAALELLGPQEGERRCELLLALGQAELRAGAVTDAKASLKAAAELALQLGRRELLIDAARSFAPFAESWELEPAVTLIEQAIEAAGKADSVERLELLSRLAAHLVAPAAQPRRLMLIQESVAMARRMGGPATLAAVLHEPDWGCWSGADLDERLATAEVVICQAERTGDDELELWGHTWRVRDLIERGDLVELEPALVRFQARAQALHQPFHAWLGDLYRAVAPLVQGRFSEAERLATEALARGLLVNRPLAELFCGLQLFAVRQAQGRLGVDDLAFVLAGAERDSWDLSWRARLAFLYSALGRLPEARSEFERIAAGDFTGLRRDATWLTGLVFAAEVCATLADQRRAATLYRLLLPHAGQRVLSAWAAVSYGSASYYLGRLATVLGDWQDAAGHFEVAEAMHLRMGAQPWLAHTLRARAELYCARGRRGATRLARAPLAGALTLYRELGMERFAAEASARLDGLRPQAGAVSPLPGGLTRREIEILGLIAAERSNREIAEALVLSERTVGRHITNIYAKIGVRGRAGATAFALSHGISQPHASSLQ